MNIQVSGVSCLFLKLCSQSPSKFPRCCLWFDGALLLSSTSEAFYGISFLLFYQAMVVCLG